MFEFFNYISIVKRKLKKGHEKCDRLPISLSDFAAKYKVYLLIQFFEIGMILSIKCLSVFVLKV